MRHPGKRTPSHHCTGPRVRAFGSSVHARLDEWQQVVLEAQSLFEITGAQRGGVVQETEPLQGMFAGLVQGLDGSNPSAQGLPNTDFGRQFADRVRQDLPEPVLFAAEKILLGWEVAEEGALGDAGLAGDLGGGRLVVALLYEQAQGRSSPEASAYTPTSDELLLRPADRRVGHVYPAGSSRGRCPR
jgi:hypothetical protein